MKITIESTGVLTTIDGVPVRLWEGQTESGIGVKVFIHRIAVRDDVDASEFERELLEKGKPAELATRAIDLRHIL